MPRRRSWIALALLAALWAPAQAQGDRTVLVRFLDRDEASAKIVDDSLEPYFSTLQPIEIAAKTGKPLEPGELAQQREECRRRYAEAAREFTSDEKKALMAWTGALDLAWRGEYPLVAGQPWSFLKVAATIEGGLPHTRGASIVLSERLLARMLEPSGGGGPSRNLMPLILAHEQTHVVQRLHPEIFEALYTKAWGFVHVDEVASNAWLERQHLANPDGTDTRFLLPLEESGKTTLVQPLVVFTEGPEPRQMPRDFAQIGLTLERRGPLFVPREDGTGSPVFRPLESLEAFTRRFGRVGALYHPNEIFAELFSTMVLHDHFGGPAWKKPYGVAGKNFNQLRSWCREQLSGPYPRETP